MTVKFGGDKLVSKKSIKKRFKAKLSDVERAAADLNLLSVDISMLEPLRSFSQKALIACEALRVMASKLDKKDFACGIMREEALSQLDSLVEEDVISAVEQSFPAILGASNERDEAELFGQLLNKLEKRHAVLATGIQQLSGLLNAETED